MIRRIAVTILGRSRRARDQADGVPGRARPGQSTDQCRKRKKKNRNTIQT